MEVLNNIDDERFTFDDYENYNEILCNGYLMINDEKEMYSVFFVYEEKYQEEIIEALEDLDNEDIFNLMQYSADEGLVWIGFEDGELVAYSSETEETANNYYNDDLNDFISELKQLESSDIVNLFVFKNTKTGDMFMASPGELDEIYLSLNKLGK